MGIQVLNKDYTIISNIIGKPKANISRIMSTVFTSPDVTPDALDWSNVSDDTNQVGGGFTYAVQQVKGIAIPITLRLTPFKLVQIAFYYQIKDQEPSWTNGQSEQPDPSANDFTLISSTTDIVVDPGYYVSFACVGLTLNGTNTLTITNVSDNNTVLDTIAGTYPGP